MNPDTKKYFEDLDSDMIKAAKKNEKKKRKDKNPFDDLEKPSKKKKKKSNKKDKGKKLSSEKKPKKKKKEKYQGLVEGTEHKMDSKFAKKILKSIKSKALRESFEHDKVLIDNRKFWTKD